MKNVPWHATRPEWTEVRFTENDSRGKLLMTMKSWCDDLDSGGEYSTSMRFSVAPSPTTFIVRFSNDADATLFSLVSDQWKS